MKHLKTYSEFSGIEEDAVTGQDSKVTVDDTYIAKLDRAIKGAEILGAIKLLRLKVNLKIIFILNMVMVPLQKQKCQSY